MHATSRGRFRAPWLIVALAAIGIMALAVGIVHFAPTPCPNALRGELRAVLVPARPDPESGSGQAVYYDPSAGGGKCSIEPAAGGLYASLPRSRYGGGELCGAYLDITGPLGTVRAEIVDLCPGCSDSQLDLSAAAFTRIQYAARGTAAVSWQLVRDPALPGPLAVRVGPGSTTAQVAIQVLNHGNPLAGVSLDGTPMSLRADGYWIGTGAGPGPYRLEVADTDGHDAVLTGITLTPQELQQTSVPMYGAAPPPAPAPTPVAAPSPSPSAGAPSSAAAVRATRSGSC